MFVTATSVGITMMKQKRDDSDDSVEHVLVFDPSCCSRLLEQNLMPAHSASGNNCRWHRQVKKAIASFGSKSEYQVVYVASARLMTPEERERSKLIVADKFDEGDQRQAFCC